MARKNEPVALVIAKGKKHLTKDEIAEREQNEIRAPSDNINAPKYLSAAQKREFAELAAQLERIEIMSNLDVDTLAMFIQSRGKYVKYNKMVDKVLAKTAAKDLDIIEENSKMLLDCENLRDRAIKQCRAFASDLGLTITSRCRLVIPKAAEVKPENKFLQKFG